MCIWRRIKIIWSNQSEKKVKKKKKIRPTKKNLGGKSLLDIVDFITEKF